MRGKKAHPEFVSQFISKCIQRGLTTPELILKAAKFDLQIIDEKIKEAENLKTVRSKLLGVVSTFDKPENKEQEAKLLPFFNLQYPDICKKLCGELKDKDTCINIDLEVKPDYVFCIKQMLECKIASRYDQYIMRGEKFDEYMKFVLREIE